MPPKHKSTVGLAAAPVRYDAVIKALELVQDSVSDRIASSMRIVIKPDFLFTRQGMHTSADAVRAVLDFILEFTNKKITIAEGLYDGSEVQPVFHKADLHELHDDYGLKYVDLNRDEFVTISLSNKLPVRVAKTILNSDFRISAAVPKLSGSRFSAASANMAIGSAASTGRSLSKNDKEKLLSSKQYDAALAELLKVAKPSLAVVDGFESVVNKKGLETNFCVASADAVAADAVAAAALGKGLNKRITKQKYLEACDKAGIGRSSISKIAVVGEKI
ncbi:DUF362 domain-containing protein [Candidatus Woesearchaeota archaeon]|nr:DUF362 domain-containing protein [Candidatus Woesearchaeota archaeon]